MKSATPKVLHPIIDKPMIRWVTDAAEKLHPQKIYLIVSPKTKQAIAELYKNDNKYVLVTQPKPLGTAHAVKQSSRYLANSTSDVLIFCGDTPLLTSDTLLSLWKKHGSVRNALTLSSAVVHKPYGYGRVKMEVTTNHVVAIVEENDASPEEKKINEINVGVYCASARTLFKALNKVRPNNIKGEYYLTDAVKIMSDEHQRVGVYRITDERECWGVNTRCQLADAARVLRQRILEYHMANGVTIIDPATTYIDSQTVIGQDTTILPGTFLKGATVIGTNCTVGPFTMIENSIIKNNTTLIMSVIEDSKIGNNVISGPWSHLRPGCVIKDNVKIGNYAEVKKSVLSSNVHMGHHSYIGDSIVGEDVNIGAGVITCNYDGITKHSTVIQPNAFIGSNSNLVAPVVIGNNAVIAAGSTITENVPAKSLAIARQRQTVKLNWNIRRRK